ncbi:hypothetical protein [Sphingorhabdus sp. Alg239-R122]|uniref:Y-family DNA polymerase n=1 Tax=Sphingorhabdus sp. Alg239-R122 TaxID=2305989 RepID=UPI0013DB1967|nr:hypothetical protein [Sphingorhabdus sp. Alg239-R122]
MFILDDSHAMDGEGLALASHASGMRFLFVDFNAYFASVEQHDDPSLRGRPVLVTPLDSEHSGAIAASYEAKAYGIKRGTTVKEARQLYPGIIVRAARHDRYVAVHHMLMREIERHLPIHRICSVDECVCRLNPEEAGIGAARAKAMEIKRGIYKNVGPALRCSIGLASSSLLAKLASDLQKPDGLTVIETETLPEALADLPLRAIPGVGAGISRRLERSGITTFTQLWNLQPKRARAIWNSVNGEKFLYALKGYDIPDLTEPKKGMIGHSRVLSGVHRSPQGARIVARALLLKAASRLRHTGYYSGAMTVSVKLYPAGRIAHEMQFRSTQNSWVFLKELDAHWQPMISALMRQAEQSKLRGPANDHGQGRYQRQAPALSLKGVTVYLHNLRDSPPDPDLFVPRAADRRDTVEAMLWNRIDALNRRYGMETVMPASQKGLDLNYLGVKIAFSRVPDASEFADRDGIKKAVGVDEFAHESRTQNPARALY